MADFSGPASDVFEYTSFASDIDLVATFGKHVRAIEVIEAGTGTLAVVTTSSGGATRTITVYDKWYKPLECTVIKAATDVTKLQVYL
jgi:hypothetical protein